jgi:DNA (cytosine-5)-methyltransferase 1
MQVGSLFSGIGGIDLGLERAGFEISWQVERDPFCQKILAKHWPTVKKFEKVEYVGKHNLEQVDLIAGGFPCQDVSDAGRRAGINGERSGLWSEFARIICELRPRFVLVENVRGLLIRGFGRVLSDLAKIGYDAEWSLFSASQFGYPHQRQRLFLIAYPSSERLERTKRQIFLFDDFSNREIWKPMLSESYILRNHVGFPNWVDRIKSLGNSVIPDIAEFIGKRVLDFYRE